MAEDKFEQAVIDKLKSEGWDYLTDYSGVTVDRLYDHWRDILNKKSSEIFYNLAAYVLVKIIVIFKYYLQIN